MDIVMSKAEVKFRRPLNDEQLVVLKVLGYALNTTK
jgi:hypothetical protein